MSRVLVVGWELPEYSPAMRMEASNYRTWQLVEPLRRDGHQVCVAAGRVGEDYRTLPPIVEQGGEPLYVPVRFSDPFWMRRLQQLHDTFRPDCLVGVTFQGALRATRLRTEAPLWADIYGDQLAEMQAKAHRVQSDRGIATQLRFLRRILTRADAISGCSAAQRHAILGQLAMAGRLNRDTFGYELAYVIPPGTSVTPPVPSRGTIRGKLDDPQATIALWCGGYNTWTDVDTLWQGLELALANDPRLHFVSVGGALPGCDSYARFEQLAAQSANVRRYHLLGWQPVGDVPLYYVDADLGISLDAACYEAELGTRTRLVEMMAYGLPLVTSLACELSYTIRDQRLGLTFPVGDWRQLGHQLLALSLDDTRRRQMGRQAHTYAATALSLEQTTAPLRSWARAPRRAPDRAAPSTGIGRTAEYATRAMVRQTLWAVAGLDH